MAEELKQINGKRKDICPECGGKISTSGRIYCTDCGRIPPTPHAWEGEVSDIECCPPANQIPW